MAASDNERAKDLVSNPLVLLSAWQRVLNWYRSGEQPPQPQFAEWLSDPDRQLEALAQDIGNGHYKPSPFPLVPYPKKGAALRHYCRPSVKDQVAFAAYGILLGPWLESVMPNFSFGNRWYRGVFQDVNQGRLQWRDRAFALEDGKFYQPYRRAHGLFRRVAHWTARAMLGMSVAGEGGFVRHVLPEHYPKEALPRFIREDWWHGPEGKRRGFWAEMDLQLAYPSVRIEVLRARLHEMLEKVVSPDPRKQVDYPLEVVRPLEDAGVRAVLADVLCDLLADVTYDIAGAPDDLWRPPHANQGLPIGDGAGHPGLPTGLVISGLLLNVYLYPLDGRMGRWSERQADEHAAAFLRFADDILLLSTNEDRVLAGVDEVWRGLCDDEDAVLAEPDRDCGANLRVNWSKVAPEPLADIVSEYLHDHRWEDCPGCMRCYPVKGRHCEGALPILSWWQESESKSGLDALKRIALGPDNLDQFVTHLVERMSELGGESLLDRFGDPARQRLTQLHQLVRFDIDDRQVRLDTRLSFAVNHLVRAWLPEERLEEDRAALREMRASVSRALRQAPWKFKLWRAGVRAAVRRPCFEGLTPAEDDEAAKVWLSGLLKHIRVTDGRGDDEGDTAWGNLWPEKETDDRCWQFSDTEQGIQHSQHGWKERYTSAHRAAFWFAISEALRDLGQSVRAVAVERADVEDYSSRAWVSTHWTFRALPRSSLEVVRAWLSDLDQWAEVLYPDNVKGMVSPLEREAVGLACLQAIESERAVDIWDGEAATSPINSDVDSLALRLLGAAPPAGFSRIVRLLHESGDSPGGSVPDSVFRLVSPLGEDHRNILLKKISGSSEVERIRRIQALGSARYASEEDGAIIIQRVTSTFQELYENVESRHLSSDSLWKLRQYDWLRRAAFSLNDPVLDKNKPTEVTLHRLLWGDCWSNEHSGRWRITPAQAVRLGFPIRVAARMLQTALQWEITSDGEECLPPVWIIANGPANQFRKWLAVGRRCQLGLEDWSSLYEQRPPASEKPLIQVAERRWEVLPHPLYLWPGVLGIDASPKEFRIWCHVLLFITAVQGTEVVLDSLFRQGSGTIPFEERWHWRHHIHMPQSFWELLEFLSRKLMGRREKSQEAITELLERLREDIAIINTPDLTPHDFRWERVDIGLNRDVPWDLPVSVSPYGEVDREYSKAKEPISGLPLAESFGVRVGQVAEHPTWATFVLSFPHIERKYVQRVMKQVWSVFLADNYSANARGGTDNKLIILPEATIPQGEERLLRRLVAETGHAVLAGCLWRVLQPVARPHQSVPTPIRYLVNEAILAVPLIHNDHSALPVVRTFTVIKPNPAHIEEGLAGALTVRDGGRVQWKMLSGSRWYRFVHSRWGDFTIAICSDLLDPVPWASLRGQILHILSCAYNKDVDLYEAMTWVRAYENYANVVLANHGEYGGSFAWSPRGGYEKEVTRLRGRGLYLVADVELPVRELLEEQKHGVRSAVTAAMREWSGGKPKKAKYKAPPPRYKRPE